LRDGKHIAFSKILEKTAEYQSPPRFIREDSSEILDDPKLSASVPLWMNIAAQVSTGGRDLVLENGPDTMNSSDEESPKHGEVLTGMYTDGLKAPVLIAQAEVARQKAAWAYAKSQGYGATVSDSPQASGFEGCDSSDSDLSRSICTSPPPLGRSRFEDNDPDSSQPVRSSLNPFVPRSSTPIGSAPPRPVTQGKVPPRVSTPVDVPPDPVSPKRPKRAGSKGAGKKAATRPADSEATHPMATRSKASRAGSLRPVGGSGQTDTCVAQGNPSKT
jgi:hypothetical protein